MQRLRSYRSAYLQNWKKFHQEKKIPVLPEQKLQATPEPEQEISFEELLEELNALTG